MKLINNTKHNEEEKKGANLKIRFVGALHMPDFRFFTILLILGELSPQTSDAVQINLPVLQWWTLNWFQI